MRRPPSMLLVQMMGGFQVSQAIYVVAKLDVATLLDGGPLPVEEIARRAGAQADPLGRLIRTLATVGLFRTAGGAVSTTPLGALLSAAHPQSLRAVALYWMETHYLPFSLLLDTVRTGVPAATRYYGQPLFEWMVERPELVDIQNRAMKSVSDALRAGMFAGYSLPAGRVVADLGAGSGEMLAGLLENEPDRQGIVFDLPVVATAAREFLAQHPARARMDVRSGNFFDAVPPADVYLMSYIFHDWDDESCLRVLSNIRVAAGPTARLVIVEGIVPEGDVPHLTTMVDLVMLGMLTGRERTAEEFETLLAKGGFTINRIVPTPSPFSIIETTADR